MAKKQSKTAGSAVPSEVTFERVVVVDFPPAFGQRSLRWKFHPDHGPYAVVADGAFVGFVRLSPPEMTATAYGFVAAAIGGSQAP